MRYRRGAAPRLVYGSAALLALFVVVLAADASVIDAEDANAIVDAIVERQVQEEERDAVALPTLEGLHPQLEMMMRRSEFFSAPVKSLVHHEEQQPEEGRP